jgi:hypothetical protein
MASLPTTPAGPVLGPVLDELDRIVGVTGPAGVHTPPGRARR